MVHALEIIHGLLEPHGSLVDIHPTSQPPPIEYRRSEQQFLLGSLQETDDFVEYIQASAALAQALEMGLFSIEQQRFFTYVISATSIEELRAYLAENWKDAVIPPEVEQNVRAWIDGCLLETLRMKRLFC